MESESQQLDPTATPEGPYLEIITAIHALFNLLQIHHKNNSAIQLRAESLLKLFEALYERSSDKILSITLVDQETFVIQGRTLKRQTQAGEAFDELALAFQKAVLKKISFQQGTSLEDLKNFFVSLFEHSTQGKYAKKFISQASGITTTHDETSKASFRDLFNQSLGTPLFALKGSFSLKRSIEEFLSAFSKQGHCSQRDLRRKISILWRLCSLTPHQLVAASVLREYAHVRDPIPLQASESSALGLLSMLLAHELHLSPRDQINLGIMGILYNVGLLEDRARSVLKTETFSDAEYEEIKRAKISGVWKVMLAEGVQRSSFEKIPGILQSLPGMADEKSQSTESQILKLTSQFVALTSDRPFRRAYTPYDALKILGKSVSDKTAPGNHLTPLLYYVFVRTVGHYPIGSLVSLSNGSRAIVVKARGEKPGFPVVKLVPQKTAATSEILDLATRTDLHISEVHDPRMEGINVAGYLFE